MNTKNSFGLTPIHVAVQKKAQQCLVRILELNIDIDLEIPDNSKGWTALHYAASVGNTYVGRALLDNGAKEDTESISGDTALSIAKDANKEDFMAILIEVKHKKSANANTVSRDISGQEVTRATLDEILDLLTPSTTEQIDNDISTVFLCCLPLLTDTEYVVNYLLKKYIII